MLFPLGGAALFGETVSVLLLLLALADPAALLERIEVLAASEPPILGIDTQIRAASILSAKQPATARRLLLEASSRALALTDLPTRGYFTTEIVRHLVDLDPAEAERLCSLLPPLSAKQTDNSLDRCFQRLGQGKLDWERHKQLFRSAVFANALSTPILGEHIQRALKEHPEEAEGELMLWLEAFPERNAPRAWRERLDESARFVLKTAPKLAQNALKRADLANSPKPPEEKKKKKEMDEDGPSTEGLPLEEVVSLARRQSDPIHIGMIIEILDDKKELALPLPNRVGIAAEALELSPKLEVGEDRLVVQSMLTRRLYNYGDHAKAAVGAQMLAETFDKMYDCESGACSVLREGDNPGEAVQNFADYLLENNIDPTELGLHHRSLDARILLNQLEESLTGKKGGLRFRIFG